MRTKLVDGRTFTLGDDRDSAQYVIVDTKLAAKTFPGKNAVGRRLLVRVRTQEPEWVEVIGVVAHERNESLPKDAKGQMYFADGFLGHGVASTWAVRANVEPTTLTGPIRAQVAQTDPLLAIADVTTFSALVDRSMAPTRFALVLIGIFAAIAAILAAVGLYGVLSTLVRMRTAEIGLRMAFGAQPRSILQLVAGQGLRLSAIGIVVGGASALLLTGVMRTMLVGLSPNDPLTYLAIIVLFVVISALASWIPARRAAGLDPTLALREE
jgi:putative ABC transport system permease protein